MARDSAAEYFFSLVDEAAAIVRGDSLRELVKPASYRIEDEEEVAVSPAISSLFAKKEEAESEPARVSVPSSALEVLRLGSLLDDCHDCEAWMNRNGSVRAGQGAPHPLILFVLDRVSPDGSFFSPQENDFFSKWLMALHLDVARECHFTSVIKCPGAADIIYNGCERILRRQIEVLSPRVVMMLGSAGAFITTGDGDIFKARGRILEYHGTNTIVSFSPSQVLADYQVLRRPVWEDLKLAARAAGIDGRLK